VDRSAPGRQDSGADQQAADDLHRVDRLAEQHDGEDRGDERLQVRGERRARRADAVERLEPEDVGDHEGAKRREEQQCPHLPAELPVLRVGLRPADQGDPDPGERQHDGADPRR